MCCFMLLQESFEGGSKVRHINTAHGSCVTMYLKVLLKYCLRVGAASL